MELMDQFGDVDAVVDWVLNLPIKKRKPTNVPKMVHETLLDIWTNAQKIVHLEKDRFSIEEAQFLKLPIKTWVGWLGRDYDSIEAIEAEYLDTGKPMKVEGRYARLIQWDKYRRGDNLEDLVKKFDNRDEFFLTLKVGSKKWKEAVKLFYIYVLEKEG